jgi:hypothetical protein
MNRSFFSLCILLLHSISSYSNDKEILLKGSSFSVIVNYQTLAVSIITPDSGIIQISAPLKNEVAIIEKQDIDEAAIRYPELRKKITFKLEDESLIVKIESSDNDMFKWPVITKFKALTIPFYQGKYIPADDSTWIKYLNGQSYSGTQDLSMQFFALNNDKHAALFMITNKFNNEITFGEAKDQFTLTFKHVFPATVCAKEYGFIIKVTDNTATGIAKEYRKYILKTIGIRTLEEKAEINPNIRKLYGAAHFIYGPRNFWP